MVKINAVYRLKGNPSDKYVSQNADENLHIAE